MHRTSNNPVTVVPCTAAATPQPPAQMTSESDSHKDGFSIVGADQPGVEGLVRLLTRCVRHKLPTLRCLSRTHLDSRNPLARLHTPTSVTDMGGLTSGERWMCTALYQRGYEQHGLVSLRANRTNSGNRDTEVEVSCGRGVGPVGEWSPKGGAQSRPPAGEPLPRPSTRQLSRKWILVRTAPAWSATI